MADSNENITELFFARLNTTTNSGVVLAQFYGALMGVEAGRSEIIAMNRLIRLFGKSNVFFSLIDISRKETFPEFPFGLLFKICKDKLESNLQADVSINSMLSLEKLIADTEKEIPNIKKIDIEKAGKYLKERDKEA